MSSVQRDIINIIFFVYHGIVIKFTEPILPIMNKIQDG